MDNPETQVTLKNKMMIESYTDLQKGRGERKCLLYRSRVLNFCLSIYIRNGAYHQTVDFKDFFNHKVVLITRMATNGIC